MIKLPDFDMSFEYENNFYLSCDITRMSKVLAHYELYKQVIDLPGEIVECGVFKGASFSRFAMFRELLSNPYSKRMIAFDMFGGFPETSYEEDKKLRERFIQEAGAESISTNQLMKVLEHKRVERNIELIEGDITKTVPEYVNKHPELKLSLINLDTDIYEPAVTILENLYPKLVNGGILILDDYGTFPGETKAVDEYFKDKNIEIKKFPFAMTPCYIIKKD
ncbi:TylF/MycF/NovP-related O-methyltransferase [Lysinibacillus sp. NPDC086135]|uniref:TylF/MycF/NovP-related O-methyltransferase n=1 Tax=Lysinibacillus sp. NPDC086135 TaxID=3364130 RepID=UPI0037FE8D0D